LNNINKTLYSRGVLELCVLTLLARGDCYGYDVSERIPKTIELAEGAVYPILRRMKLDGFVTTYLSEDSGGPPRKYYRLTDEGRREYESARNDWIEFSESITKMLEGEQE
jgi:PadR family transcriptional regulator PadR